VTARGAREGDGDPYPGWHEATEGLRRSSVGEGRQRWNELDGGARGAEVKRGGERRSRCREAEVGVPFIGREGKSGGREEGCQVATGGASSKHRLRKRGQGGSHLMRGK
jgi:hypothetical protein